MKTELFPYQQEGVEFARKHRWTLNLCPMGLGKSLQALALAERAKGKTLIICPSFLVDNWWREIHKHCDDYDGFIFYTYGKMSRDKEVPKTLTDIGTIIADEVHYCKNLQSARTQMFFKVLKAVNPRYFIGLTGTPIKNRVSEFYALLVSLGGSPEHPNGYDTGRYYPTYHDFCRRFCYPRERYFGGRKTVDYIGFRPERTLEFKTLLSSKVYRVDPDKVLTLPPIEHKRIRTGIPMGPQLAEEFEKYISSGGRDIVAKASSARLKVSKTVEYVSSLLDQGEKPVVVFTDHVESAISIAEGLKVRPITGSTPVPIRNMIVQNFESGNQDAFVATIGTMSVGVNLVRARHLVFNDMSWVPGDNAQALKRIHRIGQTRACQIHYILGGKVDEHIIDILEEKMKVIDGTSDIALELTDEQNKNNDPVAEAVSPPEEDEA